MAPASLPRLSKSPVSHQHRSLRLSGNGEARAVSGVCLRESQLSRASPPLILSSRSPSTKSDPPPSTDVGRDCLREKKVALTGGEEWGQCVTVSLLSSCPSIYASTCPCGVARERSIPRHPPESRISSQPAPQLTSSRSPTRSRRDRTRTPDPPPRSRRRNHLRPPRRHQHRPRPPRRRPGTGDGEESEMNSTVASPPARRRTRDNRSSIGIYLLFSM